MRTVRELDGGKGNEEAASLVVCQVLGLVECARVDKGTVSVKLVLVVVWNGAGTGVLVALGRIDCLDGSSIPAQDKRCKSEPKSERSSIKV